MVTPDAEAVVVLVSGPDRATLVSIAETVVDEGLVACVNVLPDVRSVYRWDGETRNEPEALALFKTMRRALPALRRRVIELHPYDVPEFLSLAVDTGDSRYLDWIADSVRQVEL